MANGELVTVFHVSFDESTKFAQVADDLLNIAIPSSHPINIYVQVDDFPADGVKLWTQVVQMTGRPMSLLCR